jgi:Enoyl-CoA hydratase/carnithine racemase
MSNCFKQISDDPHARAVVLSGAGKHFTSGKYILDILFVNFSIKMIYCENI